MPLEYSLTFEVNLKRMKYTYNPPSSIPNTTDAGFCTTQGINGPTLPTESQSFSRIFSDLKNVDPDIEKILYDDVFVTNPPNGTEFPEIVPNLMESEDTHQYNLHTNHFVTEPKTINTAIVMQTTPAKLPPQYKRASKSKGLNVTENQSTTVTPVSYETDPNAHQPPNSIFIQYEFIKSKKIEIKFQPRSEYRPRTENESKTSSHYIRSQSDGITSDYPEIYIPQHWTRQSNMNIIEVALMGLDKLAHLYSIRNKKSKSSFHDNDILIVQSNEPHVLYFRVTNEDFLKGSKEFMIELIKSKQDHIITKELIQKRKLNQSMLRFTRLYQDEFGKLQRDLDTEQYSCIMTENYGDVGIVHMGPRYGPMCGQEMVYITYKGRIVKDDLSITISEPTINWCQQIEQITLNTSVIYFPIPTFPYPQLSRANATITIFLKQQKFHESNYLYLNVIDQELTHVNLNNQVPFMNIFDHLNQNMFINQDNISLIPKTTSKTKPKKRLSSK